MRGSCSCVDGQVCVCVRARVCMLTLRWFRCFIDGFLHSSWPLPGWRPHASCCEPRTSDGEQRTAGARELGPGGRPGPSRGDPRTSGGGTRLARARGGSSESPADGRGCESGVRQGTARHHRACGEYRCACARGKYACVGGRCACVGGRCACRGSQCVW